MYPGFPSPVPSPIMGANRCVWATTPFAYSRSSAMRILLGQRCGFTLALSCVAMTGARVARAQTVNGTVVAKSDGAAVAGAIVALLDSSGHALATMLADD